MSVPSSPVPLRGFRLAPPAGPAAERFPFSVPALRGLAELEFRRPLTFLAGENGTGKSTLLEAVALAAELPAAGPAELARDARLEPQRRLAERLTLLWTRRSRRGLFFRGEDFQGFVRRQRELRREMSARVEEVDREMADASDWARGLARGPAVASNAEMVALYGDDPDGRSHGEGILGLLGRRVRPGGVHLMDEPETALSPQSQLGLLALLLEQSARGAQFVVATHSPILLAAPGAVIFSFDQTPPAPVSWDDVAGVRLYRDFLAAPGRFLRHLEGTIPGPED